MARAVALFMFIAAVVGFVVDVRELTAPSNAGTCQYNCSTQPNVVYPPAEWPPTGNRYGATSRAYQLWEAGLYEDGWCGDYWKASDPDCVGQAQGIYVSG